DSERRIKRWEDNARDCVSRSARCRWRFLAPNGYRRFPGEVALAECRTRLGRSTRSGCHSIEATPDGARAVVGSLGRQLLRAYQGTVRAAARVGLNVIVDEVLIDQTSWDDWMVVLEDLDKVWVGVRCSAEVAEDRNR